MTRSQWRRVITSLTVTLGMLAPVVPAAAVTATGSPNGTSATDIRRPPPRAGAGAEHSTGDTYTNPLGAEEATPFPDLSVIRGRDGYWYAYSSSGPRFLGDYRHYLKMMRSPDLVNWKYIGDVFTKETIPDWEGTAPDQKQWLGGPAIHYIEGRHVLYYMHKTDYQDGQRAPAIGVATAPTPAGPWSDTGSPAVPRRDWEPWPGVVYPASTIGPEMFTAPDGTHYVYYGSRGGGVFAGRLSDDGLRMVGEPVKITPPLRYEGPYVMHRDGWYYMFLSSIGGCCFGPASSYPVYAARSRSPLGPFVDREGHSILDGNGGGAPVLEPNGNKWVGSGHNVVMADLAGQDWMVFHGIDRFDPFQNPKKARGDNRHMMIDRLDWVDGWPTLNAGKGVSDGPMPAPHVNAFISDSFEGGDTLSDAWEPTAGWTVEREKAGRHVTASGDGERVLYAERALSGDVRVRGAVRPGDGADAAAGFLLSARGDADGIQVMVDRAAEALVVVVRRDATSARRVLRPLPDGFRYDDWHELEVSIRSRQLTAQVSPAGLDDPQAIAETALPEGLDAGQMGLVARGGHAALDDVTAARLHTPVTERAPDPQVGAVDAALSEEFNGPLGDEWSWKRDPAATVTDGTLAFPLQEATLVDRYPDFGHDNASALLRDQPTGEWTMETKVTIPFGDARPHGFPQAGLIVRNGDDDYILHTYSARADARWAGHGHEMTYQDKVLYAWAAVGPTEDTMWLRLRHTVNPATGEHQYRSATSVDHETWVWHSTYTMPAGTTPQVGFAAFDAHESYLARFDYLRFYRP